MRTIITETTVYNYEDITSGEHDEVLANVLENERHYGLDYEWWDSVYEDAKRVGLKITGFDTGRARKIDIEATEDHYMIADKILQEHGEVCDTYKLAKQYREERNEIVNTAPRDEDGELEDEYALDYALNELDEEFVKMLGEEYLTMLRKEYEWLISDEAILERLEGSEYEFYANGQIV